MARWNPTYKINLNDLFNRVYGNRPIEVQRQLRPILDSNSFTDTLGLQVIDRIIERTDQGIDKSGKQFLYYSKSYVNSLQFKIYGKSRSDPNLKLTGEMMASMISKASKRTLSIELIGEQNKAKAQGHVSGKLGRTTGRKRDFLGLPKSEEEGIFKSLLDDYAAQNIDLAATNLDQQVINVALGITRTANQVRGVAVETEF